MYLVTEGMLCGAALLFILLYTGTSGLPTASTFLASLEELGAMTSPPDLGDVQDAPCVCRVHERDHGHPTHSSAGCHPAPAWAALGAAPACWASVLCFAHQKFPPQVSLVKVSLSCSSSPLVS